MNYIGIPAEWNPFHAGHKSMISTLKKKYPEASFIAAMCGSFVQRGEPAFFDKWTRAKWAITNGIDVVIEFPALCALQSADYFSENQVLLLSAMGCDAIAFGTESLSEEEIYNAVSYIHTNSFKNKFHNELKNGLSYASALTEAFKNHSSYLSKELTKPNNILAFRYADAIYTHKLPLKIITVKRNTENPISATEIRKKISNNTLSNFDKKLISDEVLQCIENGNYLSIERYYDMCLLQSRLFTIDELKTSCLFTEGLENRWHKNTLYTTYTEMLDQIKNKRYLYTRLKRIGASLLFTKRGCRSTFSFHPKPLYARILAANKNKTYLLKKAKIPVITRIPTALKEIDEYASSMLKFDLIATDLQALCMKNIKFRTGKKDYFKSPFIK